MSNNSTWRRTLSPIQYIQPLDIDFIYINDYVNNSEGDWMNDSLRIL
ncbi:DNA-binding response regulator, partial [Sutcliffiella horikoshii]